MHEHGLTFFIETKRAFADEVINQAVPLAQGEDLLLLFDSSALNSDAIQKRPDLGESERVALQRRRIPDQVGEGSAEAMPSLLGTDLPDT